MKSENDVAAAPGTINQKTLWRRLQIQRLPIHFLKNAVCCGIPAAMVAKGLPSPWYLTEAQEYGIALGVAAAVTLAEAGFVKFLQKKPVSLRHMAGDFVTGATVAVGLMWAVHAVGLHPHHDHDHGHHHGHHHGHEHGHVPEALPRAQTPLRPATIPGVFTPPSHEGHGHEGHAHEGHQHGTHSHTGHSQPQPAPR